ncbi:hypothetical protein DMN91_007317 [Ooceraea biroi]|uniref:Uncharacterized protein n=1 Tax=Ooceraea biroi TaxID=2015173 RepID=A0A026WER2_OOCBI|nr:uncharacterized protein LOC105279654 [Ooceraea biroi]EZA54590.1 hypothetical protein X777_04874 [Ooceraea biroi]RLU20704.1 hypothetical protein DMN91_007317 [Ooceraea biroi]
MDANAVSSKNTSVNDERDKQSKSRHGDVPVEVVEAMDSAEQLDNEPKAEETEMLLEQLKKLQEENKQLASENTQMSVAFKQLAEENERLKEDAMKNHEFQQLQENVEKHAATVAFNALRTVFTPGQIKRIMSPNSSRVTWCSKKEKRKLKHMCNKQSVQ